MNSNSIDTFIKLKYNTFDEFCFACESGNENVSEEEFHIYLEHIQQVAGIFKRETDSAIESKRQEKLNEVDNR